MLPERLDNVCGVLLAAGAGRRAGGPKALRTDSDGTPWLLRSIGVLCDGGCQTVVVVLGCSATAARVMITNSAFDADPRVTVVEAAGWQQGISASLRAGLLAVPPTSEAVLVHLVDLPDVSAAVVARVLRRAGRGVLARAVYDGAPSHPVLLGADYLRSIMVGLSGDRGAKDFLLARVVDGVECGDLATGRDRDE